MIKNERQYRITRAQAVRFARTLERLRERSEGADGIHPMIAQAQVDAVSSQLADLEAELLEYEAIREGKFHVEELSVVAGLPALLIKARIARGLSQRELADRMGVKGGLTPARRLPPKQYYRAYPKTSGVRRRIEPEAESSLSARPRLATVLVHRNIFPLS